MRMGLLFIICLLFTISCSTMPDAVEEEEATTRAVDPAYNENEEYAYDEYANEESTNNNQTRQSKALVYPTGMSVRNTDRGKVLTTNPKILFKFASSQMPSTSEAVFSKVIEFLNNNPNVNLVLEAHTSNRGEAYPANYELSVERVRLGKKYLIENGISSDRIIEQPLGEALPEYSSQNELRRYEFVIIENQEDLKAYNNFISTLDITKEYSY